jgi:hypothetical protein
MSVQSPSEIYVAPAEPIWLSKQKCWRRGTPHTRDRVAAIGSWMPKSTIPEVAVEVVPESRAINVVDGGRWAPRTGSSGGERARVPKMLGDAAREPENQGCLTWWRHRRALRGTTEHPSWRSRRASSPCSTGASRWKSQFRDAKSQTSASRTREQRCGCQSPLRSGVDTLL